MLSTTICLIVCIYFTTNHGVHQIVVAYLVNADIAVAMGMVLELKLRYLAKKSGYSSNPSTYNNKERKDTPFLLQMCHQPLQ